MLKTRIIPTLLYRENGLVKGRGFDSSRRVGGALQAIKVYNLREVDELVFLDIAATAEGRGPDLALIDELADYCFMPMTVGGGVRGLEDFRALLAVGADKVAVNTAILADPALVEHAAAAFGSQCVVVSIDVRGSTPDTWEVHGRNGGQPTGRHPVAWAQQVAGLGAGEILLTSVERDGTMEGYDLALVEAVSAAVGIPVIASGGAGSYADMAAAAKRGAAAVAAAAMFHFTQQTPREAKLHLDAEGIPVRLPVRG
ncbi:imidazole glycerol phosphate synthase cyclase subunit [Azospirillum sp. TSO22-1]|uniref:imidazole glycerol phosphate synthase subunit HisF n=1 Tax=Azospirillum sp. TSO22-1 TaxID=716789 RepID=UPI000D615363|nr:imidazole glycerol phosphate synthase cyclase subunit [Azospirillum sp. TSO22-1]PWC54974.1 imidazole glycerol phosphate synthase [Azospirillum sp. TSO22-1]